MGHRIARRTALGALGAAIASAGAHAQDKFPSKPIEVVTHAGVGGCTVRRS
jgi:tripartite-type tricarboxylate transporter receptor subunit TctC